MRFPLLLALCALPAAVQAQHRDWALLRDSLALDTSRVQLRRREAALARSQETPARFERGVVLLRLRELTGEKKDIDQARELFEKVVDRLPNDAWAHYFYGYALEGGPHVRVPSPFGVLDGFVLGQSIAEVMGQDPRSRAVRHYLKALELDPEHTTAALDLAELVLSSRDKKALEKTRAALNALAGGGRGGPAIAVALGRIQSALGDVEGAGLSLANDHSSAGLRARAEALLRQPGKADAGAAAYLQGIERLDEAGAAAYFDDLRVVASDQELASWQAADLNEKRALLRKFWELRAASSGRTLGERLAEHYRRLARAQEQFRRKGQRGGAPPGSLVKPLYAVDQLPFDERGIIYIRHGQPEQVLRTANVDIRSNETWVYTLPGGRPQLFHFVVLPDGTDFRLVDDILLAVDPTTANLPIEGITKLLEERGPYDARYNLLASRFNSIRNQRWGAVLFAGGSAPAEAQSMLQTISNTRISIQQENRAAALNALVSDSDRPHFETVMPFYYDVFAFKGTGRRTDVTAAIAIPGTSLTATRAGDQFVYGVQVSMIVIDTLAGTVTRQDTTYQFRSAKRLQVNEHLRAHASVSAAASPSTIHRLVIRDANRPGTGQMYGGTSKVPAYDALTLTMSDIVLAEPDSGTWQRGNAHLALVPPRQFFVDKALTVFYELYNLEAGAAYRTSIALEPMGEQSGFGRLKGLFGGGPRAVRVQFEGVAQHDGNGHVQEVRRIASELKPGKYTVRVQVTNLSSGQTTTGETQFVVIKPGD